jgi:chemotaxis signal transduction protein
MSVAVMRFRAGANGYAIAAGCVEGVGPGRPDIPHLRQLLDTNETGGRDSERGSQRDGERTLRLVVRGQRLEVTVDGPIDVVEIAREDITPCRTSLSPRILGFAKLDGDMYALLDVERLFQEEHAPG